MKRIGIAAMVGLCVLSASMTLAQDEKPAPAQQQRKPLYDTQADGREQVKAALAKAGKENRRVLIQWGANWCGWCYKLDEVFTKDREVARELLYEYDLVHVDIDNPANKEYAKELGADLSQGVPFLTVLAADGKVLTNQETGSLEDGPKHDPAKVLDFLRAHKAPYLNAEEILRDGLSKAKRENKMVFLHYGAPWCGWCHRLEDWMAHPEIARLLAKDFIDVKIDIDRTIGGKDLLAAHRKSEGGGIPWFVFLDADGKEIVNSNAEAGNVGFPVKPEEIAHFKAMLLKARRNLTEADVDALAASLEKKTGA